MHFRLLQGIPGRRKSAFEPLRTLVWRKRWVFGFNDPRKKLHPSVHIRCRRDGHENRRESLVDRNIIQNKTQFLDVPPSQVVFRIQRELYPPVPVLKGTVADGLTPRRQIYRRQLL